MLSRSNVKGISLDPLQGTYIIHYIEGLRKSVKIRRLYPHWHWTRYLRNMKRFLVFVIFNQLSVDKVVCFLQHLLNPVLVSLCFIILYLIFFYFVYYRSFVLQNLEPQLRPQKIEKLKEESGPFLFTPIHFGSLERKNVVTSSKMGIAF